MVPLIEYEGKQHLEELGSFRLVVVIIEVRHHNYK